MNGWTGLMFSPQYAPWTFDTVAWVSLIAATTNAFNGALLARRPDHYKHFTVMGIIILAYAGGIGGGVVRDVLVNRIPSPLLNPWYLIFCLGAAAAALLIDYYSAAKFKDGLFQFMTAFTLPWYAIVGVQTALDAKLGYIAAVIIGCIATTAGRWIIDVACNQTPKQLVRGEFFMVSAALTGIAYIVFNQGLAWNVFWSTVIAFVIGFGFRISAQTFGWEEWEPWEPGDLSAHENARKRLGEGLRAEFGGGADE